jgi:hypothetical protein
MLQTIVAAVRSGGYPHVAAQAWGVPAEVFDDWMRRGLARRAKEPFRSFAREVTTGQAQARLRAETEVLQAMPRLWLEHGPGRERDEQPGWSASVQPASRDADRRGVLECVELQAFLADIVSALEPTPDARQAAAGAAARHGLSRAA